ncbi:general stress protein, partial [Streptomyces hirsutus]
MNEQARRTIASYTTYQEAERAVDHLSDQGFPSRGWPSSGRTCGPRCRRERRSPGTRVAARGRLPSRRCASAGV